MDLLRELSTSFNRKIPRDLSKQKEGRKSLIDHDNSSPVAVQDVGEVQDEVSRALRDDVKKGVKNIIGETSWMDHVLYQVENRIAAYPNSPFTGLALLFCLLFVGFGVAWLYLTDRYSDNGNDDGIDKEKDESVFGSGSWEDSLFLSLQVLTSAGFDDSIPRPFSLRLIYFAMIFTGLIVFAVLVGFITESVTTFMASLAEGKTKVLETGHTLILGFNEATVRVIVQISFLRRQYQMLNEARYPFLFYFPVLRKPMLWCRMLERPSTPLAAADVCVMSARKSKEEMHLLLSTAMAERGILPWRTKLGQNVICRVGDPNNVNDLIRVGAHRAGAILTMMSERDIEEYEDSDGGISNGATMRTALALRHVLFTNPFDISRDHLVNPDLRIVLQLTSPSVYVDAACFKGTPFKDENGREVLIKGNPVRLEVIHPLDITVFLNSLMFNCAAQPGLAKVIMDIFDFEGNAIRRRKVMNLRYGDRGKYGAAIGKTFEEVQRDYPFAIFVALIDPLITDIEEMKRKGYGLCPNPKIILKATDLIVFIGPRSTPMRKIGHSGVVQKYRDEAFQIAKGFHIDDGDETVKTLSNCLICGWRSVWGEFPRRLKKRVEEICVLRKPGSFLIFLNGLDFDEFASVMEKMSIAPLSEKEASVFKKTSYARRLYKIERYGVFISHIVGDASKPPIMSPIIEERTIHTAIVLGTQAKKRLNPHSQDTRVMSIMLLLRKLWIAKNEGVPMHVVSENQEDMVRTFISSSCSSSSFL